MATIRAEELTTADRGGLSHHSLLTHTATRISFNHRSPNKVHALSERGAGSPVSILLFSVVRFYWTAILVALGAVSLYLETLTLIAVLLPLLILWGVVMIVSNII